MLPCREPGTAESELIKVPKRLDNKREKKRVVIRKETSGFYQEPKSDREENLT